MKQILIYCVLLTCLSGTIFGQTVVLQNSIKSGFMELAEITEGISVLDIQSSASSLSDSTYLAGFFAARSIDGVHYLGLISQLAADINQLGSIKTISLADPSTAAPLIFDGIDLKRAIGGGGSISGPFFCYDRFVEDMQIVAVASTLSLVGGPSAAAAVYLAGWAQASVSFERCIEDNY